MRFAQGVIPDEGKYLTEASESSNWKTKQERKVHIGTPKLQIIHPLVGHLLIYTYLRRSEENVEAREDIALKQLHSLLFLKIPTKSVAVTPYRSDFVTIILPVPSI